MNISDYNSLDIDAKAYVIWKDGTFIDHRSQYNKYKICIYSLYDFFVEVFLDVHTDNIKKIRAIETEEDWYGYLDSINLDYLLR